MRPHPGDAADKEGGKMEYGKENGCPCPKTTCPNHRRCRECVIKHKNTDSLPFCLFPDNGGDKSMENLYRKLKGRFGDAE
jgi:hypothetical protein